MGRNRTFVYKEVQKWVHVPTDKYQAELADFCAEYHLNKRNLDKINTRYKLKVFVRRELLDNHSPVLIAGSIKDLYLNDVVVSNSHKGIYKHKYRYRQSRLGRKLIKLLQYIHCKS